MNPDFGQVEQDPAVLNLSVFETFLQEKRPFFTEDSRTLVTNYQHSAMFHSRRIGQRPGRFAVQDGETVIDQPDATTILGATKVTGKANGWTYGGLTALTDREYALVETAAGTRTERLIEPYTSYNVARVQKDFAAARPTSAAHATAVLREKDFDAYTGSVRPHVAVGQQQVQLERPMERHAHGHRWRDGNRLRRRHEFQLQQQTSSASSGTTTTSTSTFKNTDIGFFFNRNNKTNFSGGFNLCQPDPQKYFRSATLFANVFVQYNGDWLPLDESFFVGGEMQFLNYWNVFLGTGRARQTYDDLDTRGGPPIVKPAAWWFDSFVGTDSRKKYRINRRQLLLVQRGRRLGSRPSHQPDAAAAAGAAGARIGLQLHRPAWMPRSGSKTPTSPATASTITSMAR